MSRNIIAAAFIAAVSSLPLNSQNPVSVGAGSYAAYPPTYKAKTSAENGFAATRIDGKKQYVDKTEGQPVPTNDWWTDVIASRYSGALWSLPQMLYTGSDGITVHYPTYWNDNGSEVKPSSSISVGGRSFVADATIAHRWGDWHVVMRLPSADGHQEMKVTMVHGMPFTWVETEGIIPELTFSATPRFFDTEGNSGSTPRGNVMGVNLGDDLYGIYLPEGASATLSRGRFVVEGEQQYIVIALLKTPHDLATFEKYAYSIPRSTTLTWRYDESQAMINTTWTVTAENLRNKGGDAPVMQGFLPHAYKTTRREFLFDGHEYLTPRGTLRMAVSDEKGSQHSFSFGYRFDGMLPYYAAPTTDNSESNTYRPAQMKALIDNYAANGTFGADSYWGGKGLTQMALNMTFAKETGNTAAYEMSKRKLRETLVNWLTYTPGEDTFFFAYMPHWGSLLGFDPGYDSEGFNDHHFHYGYFTYSAALLCLEDKEFARDYGPMLTLIAKDYANWDRNDTRFPWLRTIDPWVGHSYAGGLGDAGNDNGNGQESSSESMQAWGGLYLLGVALGDNEMRDAGIFGYMTESNGVAEYWFDRDHIYPDRQGNYDYTKYPHPYNANITCKGIGWWTWFSGDPLWMQSIQWMPVSPCLNYLSKDLTFAKWDIDYLFNNSLYQWFTDVNPDTQALAKQSVGNVVLSYLERSYPEKAAEIFDEAYSRNFSMARATDTGHISYFVIQNHLTYGDLDFEVWSDCPSANAFKRPDGTMTYIVYNTSRNSRKVRFYRGNKLEKTVEAPEGMTVFSDASTPAAVSLEREAIIAPQGSTVKLSATVIDQFGAPVADSKVNWSLSSGAPATIAADGTLKINPDAAKNSKFKATAANGNLKADVSVTVNASPAISSGRLSPNVKFSEVGVPLEFTLEVHDQYGNDWEGDDLTWTVESNGKVIARQRNFTPTEAGLYTVTAQTGGKMFSHALTITPPLADVALGKKAVASSEENDGTKTESAFDGSAETRWGSDKTDNEWIYVDLGEDTYVSRVVLNWQVAHASAFEIQLATSGCRMTEHTGKYHNGQHTVAVPADDQWSTRIDCTASGTGLQEIAVAGIGRYVRMKGVRRATEWGYSLYEFRVHGIPASATKDDIIAIDIDAPAIMDQLSTAPLSARLFTLGGEFKEADVSWSSDKESTISDNKFTPATYGVYTLTATAAGISASKAVRVCEIPVLDRIDISPAVTTLIAGDRRRFHILGYDQFGADYELEKIKIDIKRNGEPVAGNSARFDIGSLTFTASEPGVYTIDFNDGLGTATVTVSDLSEANLAIGHPASASTYRGGNVAVNANDGDSATRWESIEADGQYISVDLEECFIIDRTRILWEGAYGADYRIEVSLDGENWATACEVTGHSGAGWIEHRFAEIPARFVRLVCDRRGTNYGLSLYEFEVYGTRRITDADDTATAPDIKSFDVEVTNGGAKLTATALHAGGYVACRFDIVSKASGATVATAFAIGKSGDEVSAQVDGLYRGVDYEAVLTAGDLFDNSATESVDFTGEYTIDGINLALNKDVEASSSENAGTAPRGAVDGNPDTRWGSLFNDGEWITVDLGMVYPVNLVEIDWNKPAYATEYEILLSTDGIAFASAAYIADCTGGTVATPITPTEARYVKVIGHKRATAYGTSINELRVYGDDSLFKPEIPDDPATPGDDWGSWSDWDKWGEPNSPEDENSMAIVSSDSRGEVDVYTLTGRLVRRGVDPAKATEGLLPGIYIIGGRKAVIR